MMQMRSVDIFDSPIRLGWKVHGRRVTEAAGGDLPNAATFEVCHSFENFVHVLFSRHEKSNHL